MSAATTATAPTEEKLSDLISDLINAYSGQSVAAGSALATAAPQPDGSSSDDSDAHDGPVKGRRHVSDSGSGGGGSGGGVQRRDSKSLSSQGSAGKLTSSSSTMTALSEAAKKSNESREGHRSHRHRDKGDKGERSSDRAHKHRHRKEGEGEKSEKNERKRTDNADPESSGKNTAQTDEEEKEEERVIPPVAPDFKKSWADLPDDVQRKIEKLRLPQELQAKYFKHLYTICRFLLKSSFPDTAAAANDKEPEKKEDIVVVKEPKDPKEAAPAGSSTPKERKAKGSNKEGRPTKVRNRAYATEAQMARAKQIVIAATKPMKKLYKSTEKSGQGGFGTVMVAKDVHTKQRVAVKKLPHNTPRVQENNWSEIAFLSMCKHPNICQFHKAFIVKEKDQIEEVWIAMEYLEGGTLAEAARAHRFSDQHIAYVAHEILVALKYLHSLKLVHRDLKSANVMMSIKGEIKLIDFGLCADFSEGPRVKMLGSPYWIPPEMVWEVPHTYSADIWSMAVCILELYLANPPYPASSIKCMFMACTVGLADQIPEKATSDARDFLTRCFTLDPETRPLPEVLLQHPWVTRPNLSAGIIDVLKQVFLTNSLESLGF